MMTINYILLLLRRVHYLQNNSIGKQRCSLDVLIQKLTKGHKKQYVSTIKRAALLKAAPTYFFVKLELPTYEIRHIS